MFELRDVKFKHILDIPYLKINRAITCILGASGSGKTTLLRLLNRLDVPCYGSIHYNGVDMDQITPVTLRRDVVMLGQSAIVYDGTLRDNLLVGLHFAHKKDVSDAKLKEVLAQVKLDKNLDEYCDKFSGGEKQRMSLARILLMDASVYLLDEPSSALDKESEQFIIDCLCEYVKEHNKQLIIVTHSQQVSEQFASSTIVLTAGKVARKYE